jgi:hypothetical protein
MAGCVTPRADFGTRLSQQSQQNRFYESAIAQGTGHLHWLADLRRRVEPYVDVIVDFRGRVE